MNEWNNMWTEGISWMLFHGPSILMDLSEIFHAVFAETNMAPSSPVSELE